MEMDELVKKVQKDTGLSEEKSRKCIMSFLFTFDKYKEMDWDLFKSEGENEQSS
jgi:hypothetical protein